MISLCSNVSPHLAQLACSQQLPQPSVLGRSFEHVMCNCVQAALDLLADLMTSSRECLKEGLLLLVHLTFALEPNQEFRWRAQPEAVIRCVTCHVHC